MGKANRKRKPSDTRERNWKQQNLFQTNEKPFFYSFLTQLCEFVADPRPVREGPGRPGIPYRDRVFAAVTKVFNGDSGRRSQADLFFAHEQGLISCTPHFNSLLNFFLDEDLSIILEHLLIRSSWPLRNHEHSFAIDSTAFTTDQYKRLVDAKKRSNEDWRVWRKFHVCVGVDTHIITAGITSKGYTNDYNFLRALLKMTGLSGFSIWEVFADKAYLGGENVMAIVAAGGLPYIPPKTNTSAEGKSQAWARMYALHNERPEEFYARYHQRSNVETVFSMMKAVFSARLRTKNECAQKNEILAKALCHNLRILVKCKFLLDLEINFDDAPQLAAEDTDQFRLFNSRLNYQPGINRAVNE